MSEHEYLLPLTEREREDLIFATLNEAEAFDELSNGQRLAELFRGLYDKLRALEPVGTGGTTTTEGA